jgi:hypothetical protein
MEMVVEPAWEVQIQRHRPFENHEGSGTPKVKRKALDVAGCRTRRPFRCDRFCLIILVFAIDEPDFFEVSADKNE